MNSAAMTSAAVQQYITAGQIHPSLLQTNSNNYMNCSPLQAQGFSCSTQQQSLLQNNLNQGFQFIPNVLQQTMTAPNGCAVLCYPTFMGANGAANAQSFSGMPIYTIQNQNNLVQMMYPYLAQQQQQQQQAAHQQQISQNQFSVNSQSQLILNNNSYFASQASALSLNNEQQMAALQQEKSIIDNMRIPSLMHIGAGIQLNNAGGNYLNTNNQNLQICGQQTSGDAKQVKLENIEKIQEITRKKSINGSENSYFQLAQSSNDDNTSFRLMKNHSISTAVNTINQSNHSSSGSSLTDNDYEEASSNNHTHFQYKPNGQLLKVDQGEAATAHSLSCPIDSLNTKQAFISIPYEQNGKKQKSKQSTRAKNHQKNNFESSNQNDVQLSFRLSSNLLHSTDQAEMSTKQNFSLKENTCTSIPNEDNIHSQSQSGKHNDYLSGEQAENMEEQEDEELMEEGENNFDDEEDEAMGTVKKSKKSGAQKKNSKSDNNNQQNQQNKLIKEKLLENASSAEKELLNQIQQISKQNSAKAFLKAYKKFALQDQQYIYNYEISENQYYYKVCRDLPIIRIENPSKKDLEGFYRKFKKFFNGKQYNNNTLKIVVRNKLYGKLFNDFLELHSEKWLEDSKSKNKDDLRIIIKFLQMCHQNLDYLVFLRDHDKSKDKSHSGYESD